MTAASTARARKLDVRVSVSATQTTRQVVTSDCLPDGGTVTGARNETLTLQAGTPGRWFLYAPHKGGLRRAAAPLSARGTVVRDSTMSRNGFPLACGPDAAEACGERGFRFEVTPALLERPDGRERGLAVDSTLLSSDPYPDCGGPPTLLDPPAADLFGGPSPLGPSTSAAGARYVYAPLPRALRNGCGRRRFVTHGRGHDVQSAVDSRTETTLSFTITLTRVGCLGR